MKSVNRPRTIAKQKLKDVAGGAGEVKTLQPTPNMGFPKYSAGWWDLVRSRGLDR